MKDVPMEALLNSIDQVFLLELLMLSAIMAVGCYTSYTDIHFREISNLASWGLLGLGLAGQLGFWALGKTGPVQIGATFLGGFGICYLLYRYGFWAPGDAKLFWAMVVALPPTLFGPAWWSKNMPLASTFVSQVFLSFDAPLWALLINTILINLLILVGVFLWQRGIQQRSFARAERARGNARLWLRAGLELAGLSGLVLGSSTLVLSYTLTFTEAIVAVMILYLITERLNNQDHSLLLVLPGLVLGIYTSSWAPQTWPIYLVLWLAAWAIQSVYMRLRVYTRQMFIQLLPVHALQQGMVPRLAICRAPLAGPSTQTYVCTEEVSEAQEVVCQPGRPLSAGKAKQLHEMAARGLFKNFGDRLEVELALPFAPALSLGVAVTAVIGGSLIRLVTALLQKWVGVL
jgi:hypothetical protein